ncbi:CRISPR-associated endoribonuclease Cas6 [Spirosoma litoris]
MRIHITLSSSEKAIPFAYQSKLVGVLHRWLGPNTSHDTLSLYGFSHLRGLRQLRPIKTNTGLDHADQMGCFFPKGASFFVSSHDPIFLKRLIKGIQAQPGVFGGMYVERIDIEQQSDFDTHGVNRQFSASFRVRSPVLLKDWQNSDPTCKHPKYAYYTDESSSTILTAVMHRKLTAAGLPIEGCQVRFNTQIPCSRRITGVTYQRMYMKASLCPITIMGTVEQIRFGWNVGAGHSTGIGFGSLEFLSIEPVEP